MRHDLALHIKRFKVLKNHLTHLSSLFDAKEHIKLIGINAIALLTAILQLLSIAMVIMPVLAVFAKTSIHPVTSGGKIAQIYEWSGIENEQDFMFLLGAGVVLFFVGKAITIFTTILIRERFWAAKQAALAQSLFEIYLQQPYLLHLTSNRQEMKRNVSTGAHILVQLICKPLSDILVNVILIIIIFALLFYLVAWPAMALMVGLFLFATFYYFFFGGKTLGYNQRKIEHKSKHSEYISVGLDGLKNVRVFERTPFFRNSFKKSIEESAREDAAFKAINVMPKLVFEVLAAASIMLATGYLLSQNYSLAEMLPTMMIFILASMRLMPCFTRISVNLVRMRPEIHKVSFLCKELNRQSQTDNRSQKKTFSFKKEITLKKVSFSYPDNDEGTLKDLSLTINAGEFINIIGEPGQGKSTLIDLVIGLLEPDDGEIVVDGKAISPLWRQQIGYVSPDIFILGDTIRKNIAFGVEEEEIDDKKVQKAIKLAQLEKFVAGLGKGLDEMLTDEGPTLSKNEKQCIGFARAFYRNPKVIILDNAHANLEPEVSENILHSIKKLGKKLTIISTAQRTSNIDEHADKTYQLEKGKIKELKDKKTNVARKRTRKKAANVV